MSSKKASKSNYIDTIGDLFDKLPSLPKKWRNTIVKFIPYFALIFGILGILYELDGLRQLITSSPLSYIVGTSDYITSLISTVIYLIASIFLLMAYQPIKSKKFKGWNYLFFWEVLNFISGIVTLTSITYFIIWALIIFYIIFQIRQYYK